LGLAVRAQAQEFYPKDTETYLINYYANAKDPTTAYLLSSAPGFGAGHFYAGNYATGAVMAVGQVLGIGLYVLSYVIDSGQQPLMISGLVLFAGFKIADMVMAPGSAEDHNRVVAERLKIKPLVMDTGSLRPGGRPHVAWGLALQGTTGF